MSETTGWSKGMKVINTWDGEPARTPTQIVKDWYAEYKDEMNLGGIDGFHTTELMAALAPLFAAGPWRTGWENAPRDGSVIMADFGCHGEPTNIHIVHWDGEWWSNKDREFECSLLRAFATINPPEIEG